MHFTSYRGSRCTPKGVLSLSKTHMSPYSFPPDQLVNINFFALMASSGSNLNKNQRVPIFYHSTSTLSGSNKSEACNSSNFRASFYWGLNRAFHSPIYKKILFHVHIHVIAHIVGFCLTNLQINLYSKMHFSPCRGVKLYLQRSPSLRPICHHIVSRRIWLVRIVYFSALLASFGSYQYKNQRVPILYQQMQWWVFTDHSYHTYIQLRD